MDLCSAKRLTLALMVSTSKVSFLNLLYMLCAHYGRNLHIVSRFCDFFYHFQAKNDLYWRMKWKNSLVIFGQNFCIPATVYRGRQLPSWKKPCHNIPLCTTYYVWHWYFSATPYRSDPLAQWLARSLGSVRDSASPQTLLWTYTHITAVHGICVSS